MSIVEICPRCNGLGCKTCDDLGTLTETQAEKVWEEINEENLREVERAEDSKRNSKRRGTGEVWIDPAGGLHVDTPDHNPLAQYE